MNGVGALSAGAHRARHIVGGDEAQDFYCVFALTVQAP